ncbi:NadR type nicotinamide-nucleotide adenylyltransferase [Herbihabitans rhizosphaerae]|uniref:NadR type nicotinamide-nucleotide adenylyltransferase n=1 Tax=Herbihabitans rhizosphaerae TaxID=1872711 RepID=A0A4Q7KGT5_9PSEU|nr:AAA family ATPase [Herbihabitans rhizosphaerae]RZS34339.1 NadR type nicotinamide-nucleotide adenylyltransferase [Herbihabitans rhizosphaerae]
MTRFAHGMVIGKFYPPHQGHHRLIDTAARRCDRVTVVACASHVESIPLDTRVAWLREVHAGQPHVRVVGAVDNHPVDYADPRAWEAHCVVFAGAVGEPVDAVFTGEEYGPELARRFRATAVTLDRGAPPVSGTAVRADPAACWDWLAAPVRAWFTRRVVFVGAESTGTTTVSRAVAEALRARGGVWARTRWVAEFGRELTAQKLADLRAVRPAAVIDDVTWDAEDFAMVAKQQAAREESAARDGSPVLVCDTDVLATTVWELRYRGVVSAEVAGAVRPADLYLLTDHDGVPFTQDGLRDGEHLRTWMTGEFRRVLDAHDASWRLLSGSLDERVRAALGAIDEMLGSGWRLAAPL